MLTRQTRKRIIAALRVVGLIAVITAGFWLAEM